jgi:hypothetical protein
MPVTPEEKEINFSSNHILFKSGLGINFNIIHILIIRIIWWPVWAETCCELNNRNVYVAATRPFLFHRVLSEAIDQI